MISNYLFNNSQIIEYQDDWFIFFISFIMLVLVSFFFMVALYNVSFNDSVVFRIITKTKHIDIFKTLAIWNSMFATVNIMIFIHLYGNSTNGLLRVFFTLFVQYCIYFFIIVLLAIIIRTFGDKIDKIDNLWPILFGLFAAVTLLHFVIARNRSQSALRISQFPFINKYSSLYIDPKSPDGVYKLEYIDGIYDSKYIMLVDDIVNFGFEINIKESKVDCKLYDKGKLVEFVDIDDLRLYGFGSDGVAILKSRESNNAIDINASHGIMSIVGDIVLSLIACGIFLYLNVNFIDPNHETITNKLKVKFQKEDNLI